MNNVLDDYGKRKPVNMLDLRSVELFKDLTSVEFDGKLIDLHNDYLCKQIEIGNEKGEILFERINELAIDQAPKVRIVFGNIIIDSVTIGFSNIDELETLNLFYRGKYEVEGILVEEVDNRFFYYIEFENGSKLQIFAETAYVEF